MKEKGNIGIWFLQRFFVIALVIGMGYFLLGTIFLPDDNLDETQKCKVFEAEWTLIRGDGTRTSVTLPVNADVKQNEVVAIETTLPEKIESSVYLCYWSLRQDVWIYIDGDLRREYSTKDTRLFGKTSSAAYIFVQLLPEDGGKKLKIETQTDSGYSGVFRTIYVGEKLSFWKMTFKKCGPEIIVAFMMLVLSMIGIIGGLVLRYFYHKPLGIEYLSWGVLLAGVWLLCNSLFRQILFSNVSLASDITFYCIMLLPIPFLLYMNHVQGGRYQKLYTGAGLLTVADLLICTLLQITCQKDFSETILYMEIVCIIAICSMVGTIVRDLFMGFIAEYRPTAIGLFGALLAAVGQIYLYIVKLDVNFSGIMMALGMTFLLTVSGVGAVLEVLRMEQEKHQAVLESESKARFLANMSHEIRTPINAVLGMDEIILRECTQENIREYALDIQSAGRSLLSLINDLLDFSKIDSGKMQIVPVEYELSSLINDCYQMIVMRAKEKNLNLTLENNSNLPKRLLGDEVRIRQVIINLLTNAVKYTQQGSITLSVDGVREGEDTFCLKITVKDTGIGIKKEDQEKLFQSFQRVEEERNRNIEGTGLGLAITKQLVELMQGEILVDSIYGKGSSFCVEIPQKIVSEEAVGDISGKYADSSSKNTSYKGFKAPGGRILVVDDVEMNRKVIQGLLQNTGLQIDTADCGQRCLAMVQEKKYHIIFLDHMMPGLNGIETFRRMQEMSASANKDTPIVMLTANAILGAKEEYLKEGFADYLSKPVRVSDLEAMILKYLPEDMVFYEKKSNAEESAVVAEYIQEPEIVPKSFLERLDFLDTDTGLMYCAESEEVYRETLKTYLRVRKDYELAALYEKKDWKNYRIEVHAVKSTSLMIGAVILSQKAKELELAAKEQNIDFIQANHEEMLRDYRELLTKLEEIFNETVQDA